MENNLSSKAKGDIAEDKATIYLYNDGYRIIERNYYTTYGEIDIIAFKDDILHFVEVKSGENFDPTINMTDIKYSRLISSIKVYLKKNGFTFAYCLDFISVRGDAIDFIPNISI